MTHHSIKFDYPHSEIPLILRSSIEAETYYALDIYESKKLKIILARYGCRHTFHTLPNEVTARLHPFFWDKSTQSFKMHLRKKVAVQMNTLEEAVVNHPIFEEV